MTSKQTKPSPSKTEQSWIDQLPSHWTSKRLKFCLAEPLSYGANEAAEESSATDPRFIRITDVAPDGSLRPDTFRSLDSTTAAPYLLQDGDILLARSGATVGKSFIYREWMGPAAYAGYLIRARVGLDVDPDFLFYFMQSVVYWKWTESIFIQATIQNISAEKYANLDVPLPPRAEQSKLVEKLNRETKRIDALIDKKRRLLELLEEKQSAVITHAVTKGLDPKVPMKDSGIDWLGEIPAHWSVMRLKHLSTVYDCKHVTPTYIDDGFPLVSTSEIKPFSVAFSAARQVGNDDFLNMTEGGRLPARNDIIYSRNVSVGSAARVTDEVQFCMGQDLCLIRPAQIRSEFFEFSLNSKAVLGQIDSLTVGATFKRINVERIRNYWIPLPPDGEQHQIILYVKKNIAHLRRVTTTVQMAVQRLLEYRSALITNAVTGTIDVRDLQNAKEAAA